ncbi:uncharacterized protein LOC129941688 [Eupeodes corollae]|uniref:uncharacterized protein LOC129941688 n=1 Tax=Eupeodes corollae TaxID=290404 RepID=UPI00248FD51D|nr:uncharacterized protein LOC129941688 [Eupeodes corollae]
MHRLLSFFTFCSFVFLIVAVSGRREILTAHSIGQSFAKCLGDPLIGKCLQNEALQTLDILLKDNSTWHYSEFIEFEKDQNFTVFDIDETKSRRFENNGSTSDAIAEKLLQLAQARSIRMKMNPRTVMLESKGGNLDFEEGRKKKDKNKGMAMMGGLAMIAMMAQMFLGKVLLIAGAAFVMSKIALLLSVLTSLKSKLSGGGSTDHVVTIDSGGGGHGHSGGDHSAWHRSLPYTAPSPPIHIAAAAAGAEEDHHHELPQIPDYYSQHDISSQKDDFKFI